MNELFYSLVLPLSAAGALAVLACLALSPLLNKLRPAARARALAAAFPFFLVPAGPVLALLFAAKPAPVAAPLAPVGRALDAAARAAQSAAPAVLPTQTAAPAATPDPAALVLAALPWVWAAGLGEADRRAYGLLLLDAAQSRPLPAGAAGLGGSKKELQARLAALLHPAAPGRRLTAGVAAALAAALCLTACAAAGLSTSDTPVSVPVSSASPQPLTGGEEAASEPESEPETTPLPLPMEEPAEKPELQEGEAEVKWEHWTEAIAAETDYTQDETLPLHSYVLERKALDGAEEVSGWVFYNELGAVVRKEPLDRVELQPAVRGIGRVNGEPATNLTDTSANQAIGLIWPVPDYTGVSRWMDMYHKGADVMAPKGSEVLSMAAGTVTMAQWHYSYGNVVQIDHGNGLSTLYAHMDSIDVAEGDVVEQGQKIGTVGTSGDTTGIQCHVEIYEDGVRKSLHDYFPDA